MFLTMPRKGFHGMYVEFKAKAGTLSADQKIFKEKVEAEGFKCIVIKDIEVFKTEIIGYLGM